LNEPADASLTVLVLAGQRDGAVDPLAAAAGGAYKALSPVAGRPMIGHVLEALSACDCVGAVIVSINEGSGVEEVAEAKALAAAGRLTVAPARGNLVDSVLSALESARFPVLVTTADSVLLSAATIAEIDDRARAAGADVAVALARREDVLAVHPNGQRRFYRFADGAFSNCNSYWIGTRSALAPAELFRSGGQFVKHPLRVVGALGVAGVIELIRFRFGIGALEDGFARLSRRFRLAIRPVLVTDGAAAIDVDHAPSLKVAEEVLADRRGAGRAAAA
jgi:GTP:adenosylcobinamide-phosphate guanylyltransferase